MFERAYIKIFLALLLLLTPMLLSGREEYLAYRASDVPNVYLQDSTRLLSDPNDYISLAEENEINLKLLEIKRLYGVEFAVVVVPQIHNSIEEFANSLFRLWGLGNKKNNNGLLFVLAIEARQSRFEVG